MNYISVHNGAASVRSYTTEWSTGYSPGKTMSAPSRKFFPLIEAPGSLGCSTWALVGATGPSQARVGSENTLKLTYDRAIDIADEFPAVDVIGVDLAPIQPR